MKKIFFCFVLLFVFTAKSNSQCLISFYDLDKSTNYTRSEFETFALQKGFSYNSDENAYLCDVEYAQDTNLLLLRSENENNSNLIQYVFFQKSQYLDFKAILESKGELKKTDITNKTFQLQYIYDHKLVMFVTKTLQSQTVYLISISNESIK